MTLVLFEPPPDVWDAFVLRHPQGNLLQLSSWGRLKSSSGWKVQRVAVVAEPDQSQNQGTDFPPRTPGGSGAPPPLLAGAQVLFRSRYGLSIAYVPRGPLFSGSPDIDEALLTALRQVARRRRAVCLRLEPAILEHVENAPQADTCHTWLLLKGFQPVEPIQPRSSIHLDLSPPLDQVFAGFRKGHRADIRRAEREGVTVRVGNAGDIETFYAILHATGERAAFGIHSLDYYRLAQQVFQERCCLLLGMQHDAAVASHLVFADARAGLYLYSGATEAGLKTGANHLLQWHALQWAHQRGCTHYDFWGIPDALGRAATATSEDQRLALETEAQRDPLMGVYRFKKGFGGRVVRYLPAYDQVYLPPLYALWRGRES